MFREHSNLILSDDERKIFKAEFDKLDTIDQKYDFWNNRFSFDYSEHYRLEPFSIEDFKIIPNDANETELLNKRCFENYFHSFGNASDNLLEQMKAEFKESIINSMNKEINVEYELRKIDDYILSAKHPLPKNSLLGQKYTQPKSEWFFLGYEQYLLNKKEFDWTEKIYQPKSINEIFTGIVWAKYREFVKTYLKHEKTKAKIKLTGEQQVLALLYLGFGNDIETDVQKGELYECFIDNFKQKSILKVFSNVSDYENEKNLDALIDFFRLLKLNSMARKIDDKLENLKQKRTRK